jgi:hypothetical protein
MAGVARTSIGVTMRTFQVATAALLILAIASPSHADDVAGSYDVKYEEVANNCSKIGIALGQGKLRIRKEKNQLVVEIDRIPRMSGSPNKSGAVRATSKIGPSSIEKVEGKFSVAGRVDDAGLQLVFVAEYYVNGTALCTQSWNVTGTRESGDTKAKSFGLSSLSR